MYDQDESSPLEEEPRLARKRREDDVRWLMGDVRGRRYVWALLDHTRFERRGQSMFDTHGGRQNFLLGAFEVGRHISEEVRDLCPAEYLAMVRENTKQPDEVTQ